MAKLKATDPIRVPEKLKHKLMQGGWEEKEMDHTVWLTDERF